MRAHVIGQGPIPANKLQEWAIRKGLKNSNQFREAMVKAGIMSSGMAADKWVTGRIGSSEYKTMMAVAKFLGAERIEDVFDP